MVLNGVLLMLADGEKRLVMVATDVAEISDLAWIVIAANANDLDGWDEDCNICLEEQCWPEFESCSGVVYGCDEPSACNFEEV